MKATRRVKLGRWKGGGRENKKHALYLGCSAQISHWTRMQNQKWPQKKRIYNKEVTNQSDFPNRQLQETEQGIENKKEEAKKTNQYLCFRTFLPPLPGRRQRWHELRSNCFSWKRQQTRSDYTKGKRRVKRWGCAPKSSTCKSCSLIAWQRNTGSKGMHSTTQRISTR